MINRFTVQLEKAIDIKVISLSYIERLFCFLNLWRVCTYIREMYHNNKHTMNGRVQRLHAF